MKRYKLLILSAVVAVTTVSCDKYLDINQSPNSPSEETVTPDLMLAAALSQPYTVTSTAGTYGINPIVDANELGNIFMNSWAGDVNNITGAYLDEFALILTSSFHSQIWDRLYRETSTLQTIINDPNPVYDNMKAIAKIMKTHHFQTIVDLYGDVPYSQAHLLGDNTTPAYDDDETIYRDFIVQLDDAIALIDNADLNTIDPGVNDVIFNGDMSMWKKFANTLKLRVLLREATKAETNGASQTYLNAQFANMVGASYITTNVTLNPGFVDTAGRQNPFWGNFGQTPAGDNTFDKGLIVVTDYAAQYMSGGVTQNGVSTAVNDTRLAAMYEDVAGTVVGVVQGADNTSAPADLSHLRLNSGLLQSPIQDVYVMTASEAYFLQAEAAVRGYISGTAQSFYDAGINASFALLGATPGTYVNDINAVVGQGFGAAVGLDQQIEAIMTQKWIALMGINGIESWIEYTRTGYPAVPLATTAQQAAKPNRLMYPGSEYTANSANVPAQSAPDTFTTHVFWDEN